MRKPRKRQMTKQQFVEAQIRAWHYQGVIRGVYLCDVPFVRLHGKQRRELRAEATALYTEAKRKRHTLLRPVRKGIEWGYVQHKR